MPCRVTSRGCRLRSVLAVGISLAALTSSAIAQPAGAARGLVVDRQGDAVDGAQVVFEFQGAESFRVEATTSSTGEFSQPGLPPGHYVVTAEKENLGLQSFRMRVHPDQTVQVNFQLEPGGRPAPWQDDLVDRAGLTDAFGEGVAENRAGNFGRAIAKFEEVLRIMPSCIDCYYNIGIAYTRLEDYPSAEAAFKKALEIKPDFTTGYYGLAAVYDKQGKLEEAARARSQANRLAVEAMALGRARAQNIVSQAIIFFNAGNVAEAKRQFQEAAKLDPNLAGVHYWLGVTNLAEGNRRAAESRFERYLLLAPDGQYTDEATEALRHIRQ